MGIFEQFADIKHQEGVQEGIKEGIKEGLKKAVRALVANTEFSAQKIAELLGVRVSLVRKIKKEMSGEK